MVDADNVVYGTIGSDPRFFNKKLGVKKLGVKSLFFNILTENLTINANPYKFNDKDLITNDLRIIVMNLLFITIALLSLPFYCPTCPIIALFNFIKCPSTSCTCFLEQAFLHQQNSRCHYFLPLLHVVRALDAFYTETANGSTSSRFMIFLACHRL